MSRGVLDHVYKLYVRFLLNYGNIIYHRLDPDMKSTVSKNIEQAQYTAVLAVIRIWKGASRQRLYERNSAGSLCMIEDGIEECVISSSQDNQKYQNICLMKFLLSDRFLA